MTTETRELTCREVNDFLGAYTAGELAASERALFEEHLAICPDCRTYLSQYEATRDLCRSAFDTGAVEAGVPEDLVEAILASRAGAPAWKKPGTPRRKR